MQTKSEQSKKVWDTPVLKVHGTVEQITQAKTYGYKDGVIFDIDGPGPVDGVDIGEWGS